MSLYANAIDVELWFAKPFNANVEVTDKGSQLRTFIRHLGSSKLRFSVNLISLDRVSDSEQFTLIL